MDDNIYNKLKNAVEELCSIITKKSGTKIKIKNYYNGNFAINFVPRPLFLYTNVWITKNQVLDRSLVNLSETDVKQFVQRHFPQSYQDGTQNPNWNVQVHILYQT